MELPKALLSTSLIKDDVLFNKSIILLFKNVNNKIFGLILNKNLNENASEIWQEVNPSLNIKDKKLRNGGPVYGAICVIHKLEEFSDHILFSNIYITVSTKKIEEIITKTSEYEMYIGYCTWEENQLKKEIENGFWWESTPDEFMIFGNNEDYWKMKNQEKDKFLLDKLNIKIQNHLLN